MRNCVYCQGMLDPASLRCQTCGRDQPTLPSAEPIPSPMPSGALTKRCPTCGEALPTQAHFCGRCGQSFGLEAESEPEQHRSSTFIQPIIGIEPEAASSLPGASATPQSGTPTVPGAAAGPQTSAPGVVSTPAGPQSGAPTVPTAPTGPQSGAPGVSRAPVKPPDLQSVGQATKALQGVGKGAARGLRGKLLGTTLSKVIAGALAVVVAGAAATGAYAIFRPKPQPVLQVQSAYHVGATPAGAVATTLRISGQAFASTSAITFLLDGRPAPGARQARSDGQGNLRADLTITDAWPLGTHTLTARDAQGNTAAQGAKIAVVAPGSAHTPGLNGAPPDDASFKIMVFPYKGNTSESFDPLMPFTDLEPWTLTVTSHPDSLGGIVCGSFDDGQVHSGGRNLRHSFTATCSGTYQGGKLIFSETITQHYGSGNGITCTYTDSPLSTEQFSGTFTNSTTISGTFTIPAHHEHISCSIGPTDFNVAATSGSWTGTITNGP